MELVLRPQLDLGQVFVAFLSLPGHLAFEPGSIADVVEPADLAVETLQEAVVAHPVGDRVGQPAHPLTPVVVGHGEARRARRIRGAVDSNDGLEGAGAGVAVAPCRVTFELPQGVAVGQAADAAGFEGRDIAGAHRSLHHRRQLVAHLDVVPEPRRCPSELLGQDGLLDGLQLLRAVSVGLPLILAPLPGGSPLGPELPSPAMGDHLAPLVAVGGDAGLDERATGELTHFFFEAGELLLDGDAVVQIDRPVPDPVVAGVETVDAGEAAGPARGPIDAIEKRRRRDNAAVAGLAGVALVNPEGVGVAHALGEVPDAVLSGVLVILADPIEAGAVEGPQAFPQPSQTLFGDLAFGYASQSKPPGGTLPCLRLPW